MPSLFFFGSVSTDTRERGRGEGRREEAYNHPEQSADLASRTGHTRAGRAVRRARGIHGGHLDGDLSHPFGRGLHRHGVRERGSFGPVLDRGGIVCAFQ